MVHCIVQCVCVCAHSVSHTRLKNHPLYGHTLVNFETPTPSTELGKQ